MRKISMKFTILFWLLIPTALEQDENQLSVHGIQVLAEK